MSSNDFIDKSNKTEGSTRKPYIRRRFRKKNDVNKLSSFTTRTKFKGDTEYLEGNIYDYGVQNQADIYNTTTKKKRETFERPIRILQHW